MLTDDAQIVGNEDHRHAQPLAANSARRLQYLRLSGNVERCRGFICDQNVGIVGKSHCNHDPLALASPDSLVGIRP